MKVYSIVTEDVSEAIPFTKKARMMRQAGKAAKGATKDETRQLEVELLTYLKTSGQTATADAVLKYLDQKGYGNVAAPIIANLKTKGNKKADRQAARADKRQAKADAKAAAAADAEKAAGLEKQRKGMATMSSMYSESEKRWKQTSMSSAEATKKYGKENVKVKKGGLNNGDDMVEVFVEGESKEPEKMKVTNADKKMNTTAYQRMKKGDKRYIDATTESLQDKLADKLEGKFKSDAHRKAVHAGKASGKKAKKSLRK